MGFVALRAAEMSQGPNVARRCRNDCLPVEASGEKNFPHGQGYTTEIFVSYGVVSIIWEKGYQDMLKFIQ
jgi:hypothetical protein